MSIEIFNPVLSQVPKPNESSVVWRSDVPVSFYRGWKYALVTSCESGTKHHLSHLTNPLTSYSVSRDGNADGMSRSTGDPDEEELLKGLLTDDFCHVCEAVLLFESQRLSHYEVCVPLPSNGDAVLSKFLPTLRRWTCYNHFSHANLCRGKNMRRNSSCTCRPRERRRKQKTLLDPRFACMKGFDFLSILRYIYIYCEDDNDIVCLKKYKQFSLNCHLVTFCVSMHVLLC